jgi:hypothetical protein
MFNKNILLYLHTYSQFLTSSLLTTLYTTISARLNCIIQKADNLTCGYYRSSQGTVHLRLGSHLLKISNCFVQCGTLKRPGQRSPYVDSLGTRGFRISHPAGSKTFRTFPFRHQSPPSFLQCNGYRGSFLGVNEPGCGADYPPLSIAETKERV